MAIYDETHWYSWSGWPTLRSAVVKLACELMPSLQDGLRAPQATPEEAAKAFVAKMLQAIHNRVNKQMHEQRQSAAEDEGFNASSSLWPYALRLFGKTDHLAAMLVKEAPLILGKTNRDVLPKDAVGQIVKNFLENARREISSASAHRLKVWETIDRVSRTIASRNIGTPLETRYAAEHIEAVFAWICENKAHDRNLPHMLEHLYKYFDEFCPECHDHYQTEYSEQLLALREETGVWPTIDLCLDKLRNEQPALFEVLAIQFGLAEAQEITQEHYRVSKNLSRYGFEKQRHEALEKMRICCENSIAYQLQRPQFI